jgi:uncharacterized protein (DUF433 family)
MPIRWQDYIEERKDVMLGRPVFKGTRLTVEHILKEVGLGMTDAELLDNYPTLRPEHVRAALLCAAAVLVMDETIYA